MAGNNATACPHTQIPIPTDVKRNRRRPRTGPDQNAPKRRYNIKRARRHPIHCRRRNRAPPSGRVRRPQIPIRHHHVIFGIRPATFTVHGDSKRRQGGSRRRAIDSFVQEITIWTIGPDIGRWIARIKNKPIPVPPRHTVFAHTVNQKTRGILRIRHIIAAIVQNLNRPNTFEKSGNGRQVCGNNIIQFRPILVTRLVLGHF